MHTTTGRPPKLGVFSACFTHNSHNNKIAHNRFYLRAWTIHNLQVSTQFPSMLAKGLLSLGQLNCHNVLKISDSKGFLQQDKALAAMKEN